MRAKQTTLIARHLPVFWWRWFPMGGVTHFKCFLPRVHMQGWGLCYLSSRPNGFPRVILTLCSFAICQDKVCWDQPCCPKQGIDKWWMSLPWGECWVATEGDGGRERVMTRKDACVIKSERHRRCDSQRSHGPTLVMLWGSVSIFLKSWPEPVIPSNS